LNNFVTTIFGQNLIYWSGVLTGIGFLLTFMGCRCVSANRNNKLMEFVREHHNKIIRLTLLFFLAHLILAVLSRILEF